MEQDEAQYLGASVTAREVTDSQNIVRTWKATKVAYMLQEAGVNSQAMSMGALTTVVKTVVLSTAGYAIHLVRKTETLKKAWINLEKSIASIIFGGASETQLNTIRILYRFQTLEEMMALRLEGLLRRIQTRAKARRNDKSAQDDPKTLRVTRTHIAANSTITRKEFSEMFELRCGNRARKIPSMVWKGRSKARAVLIWYSGSFPVIAMSVKRHADVRIRKAWITLQSNMTEKEWSTEERSNKEKAIKLIKSRMNDRRN